MSTTRTRNPVVGEDVLFFVSGDRTTSPLLAKVMQVATYNSKLVKLFFYSFTSGPRDYVYHCDEPLLETRKNYLNQGTWDWHPQIAQLFDMATDSPPTPSPPVDTQRKQKRSAEEAVANV